MKLITTIETIHDIPDATPDEMKAFQAGHLERVGKLIAVALPILTDHANADAVRRGHKGKPAVCSARIVKQEIV